MCFSCATIHLLGSARFFAVFCTTEGEGFEPPSPFRLSAFKADAISLSAILPRWALCESNTLGPKTFDLQSNLAPYETKRPIYPREGSNFRPIV